MQIAIRSIFLVGMGAVSCALSLPAHANPCHPPPRSNIGCEFYAVTMANAFVTDPASYPFAIRALNPSTSATATLQISGGALAMPQSQPITAGSVSDVTLPWVSSLLTSTGTSLVTGAAYHLVSDLPLSVVQFNTDSPASGVNDATLLMPVQNAGTSFIVDAWPEEEFGGVGQPAQVAIVATKVSTSVQITGQNIQPGAGLTATGGTVSLNAGDVLQVSSALSASVDISGMRIDSSAPVIVLVGHAGADVPAGVGYADHLEDALPPLNEIGRDYLLVRPSSPTGGNDAKQFIKLTGTVDGTAVSVDPSVAGAPAVLNAGESAAFEATVDVHVQANQPIVSSQFMESATAFANNSSNLGDPSQLVSISTDRGALSIDFIAPTALVPIFAQVIAPTGTAVTLDSSTVSGWQAIGSSGYSGANVILSATDVHHATAAKPFTLSVYAYPGANTSYWYAGGLGPSDDIFGDGFNY